MNLLANRKNTLAFLISIIMLVTRPALATQIETPESIQGTTRVSAEGVIDLIDEYEDLIIVDARKAQDHAAGFIEGSISLPNTETNPESLASIVPSKSTPVLFYCNGEKCGRSVESCKLAVSEGYKSVYWFRGGWDEWMEKGLPVTF